MLYLSSGVLLVGSSENQLEGFGEEDRRCRSLKSFSKQFLSLHRQPKTAPKERAYPIFVASEQDLDTSVYKRVFKPPRLNHKYRVCSLFGCVSFACGNQKLIYRITYSLYFLRSLSRQLIVIFVPSASYSVSFTVAFSLK